LPLLVSVEVRPVTSRAGLREFIELPFRLHGDYAQWIPPLRIERHAFLSRRLNPFFRHGDARYFLAWRDGRVVGRVSAHVDHALNEHQGSRWGMFGFFDLEDDPEVAAALLAAVRGWLRARGLERMVGPMDFRMNDESGLVVEGHEREPFIRQPWHPPYYQALVEGQGLTKAVDLLTWELAVSDRDKILPIIFDLSAKAGSEHGITLRKMRRRTLRRDLDLFAEVYNAAWSQNWGFVPYTKQDLDGYALELHWVFSSPWFMVAEKDGEVAGVAISTLDINQVFKRCGGRLLPFGWWHVLNRAREIDRVRVGFLGVKPEFQHTGVAARFYTEHYEMASRERQTWAEMGWILEENPINRGMEALGGRVVKRFRVYEESLV